MSETVGIVGLGIMGQAMAERLASQDVTTHGWTRSGADPAKAQAAGFQVHDSLGGLVAEVDIILLSLFDDAAVRAVLGDLAALDLTGKLVVDTSTVSPACVRDLEGEILAAGGRLMDAPIAGGPEMLTNGTASLLAGGDASDIERFRAVGQYTSGRIVHIGALGSGAAAKIVNNTALAGAFQTAIDALDLGEKLGLDLPTMLGFFEGSPGITPMFKARIQKMLGTDTSVGFTIAAVRKDMKLFLDVAQSHGVDLPSIERFSELVNEYPDLGHEDPAALIRERFKQR